MSNALSDKKMFPTFTRSSNLYNNAVPILVYITQVFHWNRLVIITDVRDLFRSVALDTKEALELKGVTVLYHAVESAMNGVDVNVAQVDNLRQHLKQLRHQV